MPSACRCCFGPGRDHGFHVPQTIQAQPALGGTKKVVSWIVRGRTVVSPSTITPLEGLDLRFYDAAGVFFKDGSLVFVGEVK